MAQIHLTLDDRQLRRNLDRLRSTELGRVTSRGLNRVGFEIRDAERDHTRGVFDFAGPSTERFLSGAYRFDAATPTDLSITVFPLKRSENILADHAEGAAFTADDGERLAFRGQLAVPIAVQRGRSGRVPKRLSPSAMVERGAFVSTRGRALLGRVRARGPIEVLYALVPRARVRPVLRFVEVAKETAQRELPSKIRRELEKLRLR